MKLRLAALTACTALLLVSQNQPHAPDLRHDSLAACARAPVADVLKSADEWLLTYEHNRPDPNARPPYLTLARFYALKGVRTEEIPTLLEKGVAELFAPGSCTQRRAHGNSPFEDDIEGALAAGVYIQIKQYDRAGNLLNHAGKTVRDTNPAGLDPMRARCYEALRFQYWDGMTRLSIAEGRKDDALAFEHAILTNPKNVASRDLIEEHRQLALQLWKELGKSGDFQEWLAAPLR